MTTPSHSCVSGLLPICFFLYTNNNLMTKISVPIGGYDADVSPIEETSFLNEIFQGP